MLSEFHKRLRQAMERSNIKQSELCEKTGIGKSSISQYLSGDYEPKQRNIYKIATALNVSPAYLMGYTNDPENYATLDLIENPNLLAPALIPNNLPTLTPKDERNIQKRLKALLDDFAPNNGALAYYDGEEPMSDEDRELIRISLENTLRMAKQMAKQKFTPKKYRK
jgi:transcriptional regulator with XRE-family HTH domain